MVVSSKKHLKKISMYCLIIIIGLSCTYALAGSPPPTLWENTYTGKDGCSGMSVCQTSDGGYLLLGGAFTYNYNSADWDMHLIKTDANGNELWSNFFGGTDDEIGYQVKETNDGGYILAGFTASLAPLSKMYLVKTDSNGNEKWSNIYGGMYQTTCRSVQQTSDGGFILLGGIKNYTTYGWDMFLVKTNAAGKEKWSMSYGGDSTENGLSVQQTSDGGYILAGRTYSYGAGNEDIYLVKTDSNGNELWSKTFGGPGYDNCYSVKETSDGGYILIGMTSSFGLGVNDIYLVKTDSNGNELWSKTFGGTDRDNGQDVIEAAGGGYVLLGSTLIPNVGWDMYLIRTDANGNELWSNTYDYSGAEDGKALQQTTDNGYILLGNAYEGLYLVKTAAE